MVAATDAAAAAALKLCPLASLCFQHSITDAIKAIFLFVIDVCMCATCI